MWESVEHGPLLLCEKSPESFLVKGRKHAPFVYRLGGRSGEEVKVGFHNLRIHYLFGYLIIII